MALLSADFRPNLGIPETSLPVQSLLGVREEMVVLICENICTPGTARILIDFSTQGSSDPTAQVSLPTTYIQEWQDQPVATKRILLRTETAGVIFNDAPWLREILADANAESERATYRGTENGVTALTPQGGNGSLYINRCETTNTAGYNPHTANLFVGQLDGGETAPWIDAVGTNPTPTTLILGANVSATSLSVGATITLNRYDSGELTLVTGINITAAGAIGPFTVNITIPDNYYACVSGFEAAVVAGGFTWTQSWDSGTWCHLPAEKFFDLTQRYGRGMIRMLAHAFLIKCGVPELYDQGYLAVARLENPNDWRQMITAAATQSLYKLIASYGNRKQTYAGRFADGAHFFMLPNGGKPWDVLRSYIKMDELNSTVRDLSYRIEENMWSPMIWCVKCQNPEGVTTVTSCNMLVEQDQSFAYTTSNPDNTEVSPVSPLETLQALFLLNKMSIARLLEPGDFEAMKSRLNDPGVAGQNAGHLSKIFGIIGRVMSGLSPLKKLGQKYVADNLTGWLGAEGANSAAQTAGHVYDAITQAMKRREMEG